LPLIAITAAIAAVLSVSCGSIVIRRCITNTADSGSATHIKVALAHRTSATFSGCVGLWTDPWRTAVNTSHRRLLCPLLETLLVKAVTARITKNDEGEILFVPARHRFIADWTIFAVNCALFLWLRPLCALALLTRGVFVGGDYATVSDGIGSSRRICKDFCEFRL